MYSKAIESFKSAMKNGNSRSSYQLGVIYRDGLGIPKNTKLSTEYFVKAKTLKKSIDINPNPSNKNEKAEILHLKGKKCLENDKNKTASIHFFKLTAKKNYIESMKELYNIYSNKIEPIEYNYLKALKYAKMAADKGDIESVLKTASMFDLGEGTKINKKQAFNYYQIAAEKGDIDAIYNCGMKMIKAEGCRGNKEKGIQFLKSASKSGHKKAKKQLKIVEVKILKRKIEEENDTKSMIKLSQMLIEGKKVQKNLELAHKYLLRAAKLNDSEAKKELKKLKEIKLFESDDTKAIVDYGKSFEFLKTGKEKDFDKAQLWYKRAAELRSVIGMVNYTRLLDFKIRDYQFHDNKEAKITEEEFKEMQKEVLKYYKIASDKGNKVAMFKLGLNLEHGNGIKEDKQKAVEYYRKSAQKGHAIAMANYARCL